MQDKDAKKVQELATELERIKKEMEDNKEALKEKEIECLQSKVTIFLLQVCYSHVYEFVKCSPSLSRTL